MHIGDCIVDHPYPDDEFLLRLQQATVIKGAQQRVLDNISLGIREGEQAVILGPNGSGKSSLIKLVMRQDAPLLHRDGPPAMLMYGQARWDVFELRKRLGIVSADMHQLFVSSISHPEIVGLDVVVSGFFASVGLFPHQEVTPLMRQQALDALTLMEITHLAHKPMATLSTGEARRLLIARALASNPGALLLDEPTTGLDLLARQRFLETLRGLARSGKTVLLVTHHIEEILPEVERVILLKAGRVFLDGPKEAVLTSAHLSDLYDAPIRVQRDATGYYTASVAKTEQPTLT
jgi:iron complex transport system ATP-binding protein